MIEQIVDLEVSELIRFYGTLAGTEGISEDNKQLCNENIKNLLRVLQPKVTKLTTGLITTKDGKLL